MRRRAEAWLYGLALAGVLAYLFYRSLPAFFLLLPAAWYFSRKYEAGKKREDRRAASRQLRDGLLALSASVRAGHSGENAFLDAAREVEFLYGKNSVMAEGFYRVSARVGINMPLEKAVRELAEELDLPEGFSFAEVFGAARRTGGRTDQVIQETVQILSGRLEAQEEIYTLLRGRQYELKIMKAVPLLILFYMDLTSPGFFEVLYGTLPGRVVMTVCLAVYLAAWALADRIGTIEV